MHDISFDKNDFIVCLTLGISLLGFIVFWFVSKSKKLEQEYNSKHSPEIASEKFILFTKYWGFVWMGVISALVCLVFLKDYSLGDYGIKWDGDTAVTSLVWTLGLCALVTVINFFNTKKPKSQSMYPQIRAKVWNKKLLIKYFSGWFFYLLCY